MYDNRNIYKWFVVLMRNESPQMLLILLKWNIIWSVLIVLMSNTYLIQIRPHTFTFRDPSTYHIVNESILDGQAQDYKISVHTVQYIHLLKWWLSNHRRCVHTLEIVASLMSTKAQTFYSILCSQSNTALCVRLLLLQCNIHHYISVTYRNVFL